MKTSKLKDFRNMAFILFFLFLPPPNKPPFLLCFSLYCLKNGQILLKVTTTEACVIPCMLWPQTP